MSNNASDTPFSVSVLRDMAKLTLHGVQDQPGIAANIFQMLSLAGVNVHLVVQTACQKSKADISLAITSSDLYLAEETLKQLAPPVGGIPIEKDEEVALVILQREKLSQIPGIAARMFRALASSHINIDLISTSLNSITCLIDYHKADDAELALYGEFIESV